MSGKVTSGFLHDDVPYLKVGQGPPLVMVQGLSPDNEVPSGAYRHMALSGAAAYASHFTVYCVGRKKGLRPGESMSDIAGHLVAAIEHDIGQPVFLHGMSTGGSVALQLAIDRAELVRRLVLLCAAHRLGERGRAVQAELAGFIRAGDVRTGWAQMMVQGLKPKPLRGPVRRLAWLASGGQVPDDPTDLLVTVEAEDAFDVRGDLSRVAAPTLVIGGDKDPWYSTELFEQTAAGVQDGRAHVFEGWGHARTGGSRAAGYLGLGFLLDDIRGARTT